MAARKQSSLDAINSELEQPRLAHILTHKLDLMSQASIELFAAAVAKLSRAVDILINNASIMASPLMRNDQGIEAQLMTNYLGHAMLTSLLSPMLINAAQSRIVTPPPPGIICVQ